MGGACLNDLLAAGSLTQDCSFQVVVYEALDTPNNFNVGYV